MSMLARWRRIAATLTIGPLGRVKLLYMVVFAAYGTTTIYRTLYFRRVGLGPGQIGVLIALQPLIMLIAGPLWSFVADRLRLRGRLLTWVLLLSILPMLGTGWVRSYGGLFALTALHALFAAPIEPLMNASALSVLADKAHQFSIIRGFGSLGYAPVMWLMGYLIQAHDIRWIFAGYALCMILAALVSITLAASPVSLGPRLSGDIGRLIRQRSWLFFACAYFAAMGLQAVTFGYLGLYLDTLGASESTIGYAGAIGSFGQTAIMVFALPTLLRRLGAQRMIIVAFSTMVLRFAVWALLPIPMVIASCEILLGLAFGAAYVAGVDFARQHAPPGLETTSQALIVSLVSGLGRSSASVATGLLYGQLGPQNTFMIALMIAGLCVVVSAVFWGPRQQRLDAP